MWTAATTCPRPCCPSDTAYGEPILHRGVVVAVVLTCRVCGTSQLVPHQLPTRRDPMTDRENNREVQV